MSSDVANFLFGLGSDSTTRIARQNAWETKFARWRSPPSDHEAEKIERTERMIRQAIEADTYLSILDLDIYAQGSYSNNTNVRGESDIDICVVMKDTYFYETVPAKPTAIHSHSLLHSPIIHQPHKLKIELHKALMIKFGSSNVSRANKCLKIRSSTARVDADVVPATVFRHYFPDFGYPVTSSTPTIEGIAIHTDSGEMIKSWPKQHIENGRLKNVNTSRRFKATVRILKLLNLELAESNHPSLKSFLIENLVYNCPDYCFDSEILYDNVHSVLAHILLLQGILGNPDSWLEIHGMKKLFDANQPWTVRDVLIWATIIKDRLRENP